MESHGGARTLENLEAEYDLVVLGGGITGAGVFHRAVQAGFKALLVEAKDFAWGTSSRSSKMVHGGLRYLKEGKFLLTRAAVKERQRLLGAYPGLVAPLNFTMPIYDNFGPSLTTMKTGLSIYSLMAGKRQHQLFNKQELLTRLPGVNHSHLHSGVGFKDAQVDDARLVLRLIFDSCDAGGHALNYTRATGIERTRNGFVSGVSLVDVDTGKTFLVKTRAVVNATGVFAETFQPSPSKGFHIRPLRGSHLIFPGHLYPIDRVVSFVHPADFRPVFIFPWEGCLILGTTDVDHEGNITAEPAITREETDYLMEGAGFILPELKLSMAHCISSIAGVRPVLSRKKKAASKESREHVVWKNKGLVTITGGKLTTFNLLAADALKAARKFLPAPSRAREGQVPFASDRIREVMDFLTKGAGLENSFARRLCGRYGARVKNMASLFTPEGKDVIGPNQTLWAELCHGAAQEQVRHLSDLLLRRTRLGLFLPQGGMDQMDEIQARLKPYLPWDRAKWDREIKDYDILWQRAHAPCPQSINKIFQSKRKSDNE